MNDVVTSEQKRLMGSKQREHHALKKIDGYAGELKKTALRKLADTFLAEDLPTVKKDLISEVIIPTIKDFIADVFIGAIERTLYGGSKSKRRGRSSRTPQPSYASYYTASGRRVNSDPDVPFDEEVSFNDIVMRDRAAAQDVLDTLKEAIRDYKSVSVAELFEALGEENLNYTNNYIGWTDLSEASIRRVSTGYWVCLPKPEQLR